MSVAWENLFVEVASFSLVRNVTENMRGMRLIMILKHVIGTKEDNKKLAVEKE